MSRINPKRHGEVSPGSNEVHKINASWAEETTPWKSIYITCGLTYFTAVQFGLYFSSLWPYLQILDKNVTENFFGYIVAAYSLGQIIGSPLVGFWSNKIKTIRTPLLACLILSLTGNVIYISAALMLPRDRKFAVLAARLIIGLGASAMGLLRTFAATASTKADRTRAIAFVTGGFALGMSSGPALQLLFTPIGYPGLRIVNQLSISMYTSPAYAGCLMNLLGIILLMKFFEEKYAGLMNKVEVQENGEVHKVTLPPYDNVAVIMCYISRFTQMFTYTNLETVGAPLAMAMFSFSKSETVKYLAITHSALSGIAFGVYLSFIVFKLDKYINFRRHVMIGMGGLVLFHIVTYSYPFYTGHLNTYTNEDLLNANGTEPVGCNKDRFSWCSTVHPINVWLYFVSYAVFIGLCFPNINISIGTLFSNILGPRRQATQQGIMQTFGSFARLLGPIAISNLYTAKGPTFAWILEIVVLLLTILLWGVFYRRLVPLKYEDHPPPLSSVENEQKIRL